MVHNYSRAIISIGLLLALLLMPLVAYAAEQTEVNIPASSWDPLGNTGAWCRLGQRLTIHGTIIEIGYRVARVGYPTGNITFSIYDAETNELLFTRVWGDASELPTSNITSYPTVTVMPALTLNQEVRLCVEYYGGNAINHCLAGYYTGDRIAGQWYTNYMHYGAWHDIGEAEEGSYYLKYIPANNPNPGNGDDNPIATWTFVVFGFIGAALATLSYVYVKKRKNKG